MYQSSEDAMEAAEAVSVERARAELARHGCRILHTRHCTVTGLRVKVTNDIDPPEWIACNTRAILEWLGY